MGACRFGLGVTQTWLWLVFLSGPLLSGLDRTWGFTLQSVSHLPFLFLALHFSAFLCLAGANPALRRFRFEGAFSVIAAVGMTIGTALLAAPSLGIRPSQGLAVVAVAVSGVAGAFQVALWGAAHSVLDQNERILCYAGSVAFGTMILFGVARIAYPFSLFVASILPVVSWWCLTCLSKKGRMSCEPDFEPRETGARSVFLPIRPDLVSLVALTYLVGGLMHRTIYVEGVPFREAYWLTNLIYGLGVGGLGLAVSRGLHVNLRQLGRAALSALGLGFLLFPLSHSRMPALPYGLFQLGFAALDMYTWIVFTGIAAKSRAPEGVVAAGLALLTGSMLLGEVSFPLLVPAANTVAQRVETVSLVGAALMFVATVLVGDEERADRKAVPAANPTSSSPSDSGISGLRAEGEFRLQANAAAFLERYGLTPREREIALLLLDGMDNYALGRTLRISNNTLKTHLRSIYRKIGVSGRQEMLAEYCRFAVMERQPLGEAKRPQMGESGRAN